MTIQEAIRECEDTLESARKLEVEKPGFKLPGHDHYVDFLETLLAAARKGAAEELQTERDELIEESKQLTVDSVGRALAFMEDAVKAVEHDDMCLRLDENRLGLVLEPVMHTALAALRKVQADLLTMGEDAMEGSPRVHVVQMQVNGPEDMEKTLKQVEGDLDKIFGEAAKGKA